MRITLIVPLTLLLSLLLISSPTHAAGWGNLKGQIVFDGDVPEQDVAVAKGQAPNGGGVCAADAPILDDSLVINTENKGIANCVVYIADKKFDISPELKEPKDKELLFDNKDCVFVPHVLVVQTNQTVRAINSDPCGHNVKTNMMRNKAANQLLVGNDTKGAVFEFKVAELLPMKVECNIHAWMTAHWYVVDHPYAVVTDKDGNFEIEKLPAGDLTFKIWQEKDGYIERSLKVSIKDGETTDLGKLAFKADKFK